MAPGAGGATSGLVSLVTGAGGLSETSLCTASAVALASATTWSRPSAFSASVSTGLLPPQAATLRMKISGIQARTVVFMTAITPPLPSCFANAPSSHSGNDERFPVIACRRAVRPALCHDLVFGPEAHAFHAVLADVAEAGTLPAAEAVIADRDLDRHVDADHADIDAGGEFAGGVAVAGEDGDAVAIFVARRKPDRFLEVLGADDLQHRAEDFVLV